jgi:hypothetical protein
MQIPVVIFGKLVSVVIYQTESLGTHVTCSRGKLSMDNETDFSLNTPETARIGAVNEL